MQKPNLFFDFDDSLFYTTPAVTSFLNEFYGISIQPRELANMGNHLEVLVNKHLNGRESISRETVYHDYGTYFIPSIERHASVVPFEGTCETVERLSKKYYLWIVTARQKHGRGVIDYLLQKYIPSSIKDVHCVWENLGNGNFAQVPKRDFIMSVPGEKVAFFDDSPQEIERMQDLLPSYLFDPHRLYNDMGHIPHRVHSIQEFGELFL